LRVAVRRRDHAHVDDALLGLADAAERPLLEEAEEPNLRGSGELADLVEEERPVLGRLDEP
jgi:hypothetical protein